MNITLYIHAVIIIISLAVIMSIVLYSMKTGISPMPSSKKVIKVILDELKYSENNPVVDTGSGWGSLVCAIAVKYPQRRVTGYELSPLPWLFSLVRKKIQRLNNLTLYRRDFMKTGLSSAPVLVCYLFPGGMKALELKIINEEIPIDTLISSTFAMPSIKPVKTIIINDIYKSPVYVYKINDSLRIRMN